MRKQPAERVSLSTVARQAGVSISTVSRIANGQLGRASGETVELVQRLLNSLGYKPDPIGQALRHRKTRVVAMLAPNLNNPAMAAIASSTETALRAAGYVMILCDTYDEADLQDQYLEAMQAQSVLGYVVVSASQSDGLSAFLDRGEPVVLVNRRLPSTSKGVPFVGIDNRSAGAMAADFLLDRGLTSLGIIHTSFESSAVEDRVGGFLQQASRRGMAGDRIRTVASGNRQHLEAGYEAARELAGSCGWPQGLFCVSDLMAYGAHRLAMECDVNVPRDCLITGIDDNSINAWVAPWLSSVHIPYADFGAAVLAQLQAFWAGDAAKDHLLPHRMVDRTRPVRSMEFA